MKSIYYREQKHICGKNYDTSPYMEVDLYPVTPKQHKASHRAKRKEASTLAQQTYNDNRAKRYHVQLVNANFGKFIISYKAQAGFYTADRLAPYAKTGHLELGGKCVLREALRGAGLVDSIAGDIGLALVCINLQTFSPRFT